MPDIPKWKIPPNPDVPYEKNREAWADYWYRAIQHGEDFIATPSGCYKNCTAPVPPDTFGRTSMAVAIVVGFVVGVLFWHIWKG